MAAAVFSDYGEVRLFSGRQLRRADLDSVDVLLVRSVTQVNHELLGGSSVRIVGTATAGTDHLDFDYLDTQSISHFSAAGCNAQAVAEYVLAVCCLAGRITPAPSTAPTIGIVGYGHVGRTVARLFTSIGYRCLINDPPLASISDEQQFVALDEVLRADIVSLHAPLVEHGEFPTRNLIAGNELARMRDDVVLINAARGGIINEADLAAWRGEHRGFLALDCWAGEPRIDTQLLSSVDIATPHIAGHTSDARLRATTMLSERLAALLKVKAQLPELAGGLSEVTVPASHSEEFACISHCVLAACDPRIATARLVASGAAAITKRGEVFDALRREAVSRREFSHYRIASDQLQSDTIATLQGLGFQTTTDGLA